MNVFQSCTDTSDVTPLYPSQGLYLKPAARINMSVHLPTLKLPGKTISNWEVMEKLRHWASPEEFIVLKVSKSTLEFIRFEGEIENRSKLSAVLARLDGRSIKLSGFPDPLKVRAAEAKPDFPSRYSWDSYFRDAKNMNEMKPGERPDTIHFTNLPCKWFSSKPDGSKPSEHIFRKVFETFGEVRCVDIPMMDPYRNQMKSHISGVKMFSHNQNMIFEAYVQYKEYFCFVKAMDALRGMKLLYKGSDGRAFSASVKVDFDKTKHLSDSSIRRRRVERERLIAKDREREENERQAAEQEQAKKEAERRRKQEEKEAKLERRRKREEKRKAKELAKLKQQEAEEMNKKIATEERLLLMAQRRLESIRLLGELFNRIKDTKVKQLKSEEGRKLKGKEDSKRNTEDDLMNKEQELRDKLVKKFKTAQEHKVSKQSKKLQRTIEGNKLRSVLASNNAAALSDMSEDETSTESSLDASVTNAATEGASDWKDEKNFEGEGDQDSHAYRGRYQRGGRGLHFGGRGHYPPGPYQFPSGGNYFSHRRGYRWPRYSNRGRGGGYMQPLIDPVYLDINHQYYKYFHKLAYGDRGRSYSKSSSRSRSRSRSRSSYSRSYSRSYTRSRSRSRSRHRRSRSRSASRRRGRSRKSRSRSRSYSKRRSRSYSKRRSRSYSKRRSRKHSSSHHRSKSASNSTSKDKQSQKEKTADSSKDNSLPKCLVEQLEPVKSPERFPSIEHTWSRSPSRSRSISWEKRSNDDKSDSKRHKHKKNKHKKKKKKRNKDSKDSR